MLANKYSKLYYKITDNANQRTTEGYTERHHITPQSMGGSNDTANLVELTAREHFICHWLLIKMTEGKDRSKMVYALNGMKAENKYQKRYHTKITARVYETYRIEHAANHSKTMKGRSSKNKGIPMSSELKQKLREKAKANHASGKVYSEESQKKRLSKMIGYTHSEETKQKQSLASKGKPKGPMSEEEKLKRSVTQKGVAKVKTHATNVANAVLGNISINKDNTEKKVKKDTLQSYLDDGWQLGGKKRKIA
jgi:hypothetical protein